MPPRIPPSPAVSGAVRALVRPHEVGGQLDGRRLHFLSSLSHLVAFCLPRFRTLLDLQGQSHVLDVHVSQDDGLFVPIILARHMICHSASRGTRTNRRIIGGLPPASRAGGVMAARSLFWALSHQAPPLLLAAAYSSFRWRVVRPREADNWLDNVFLDSCP